MLRRARDQEVVGHGARRVRVDGGVEVELSRQRAALRGPELQPLVVRARQEGIRIEGIEVEVRHSVAVAAALLVPRRPRNRGHGTVRVLLVRVPALLEVPYLDGPLGTARHEQAPIELVEREAADSGAMGAYAVRPAAYVGRVVASEDLAIEAMLRCGRKRSRQVGGDGARKLVWGEFTRLAGEEASLHSSGLAGHTRFVFVSSVDAVTWATCDVVVEFTRHDVTTKWTLRAAG